MDDLKSLLTKRPIQDIIPPPSEDRRTERGEWLKKFCDRLNPERRTEGMQPLSMGRMGRMLEQVPTGDLYAFYQACDRAKHFGKYFWYSINPKKHEQKEHV